MSPNQLDRLVDGSVAIHSIEVGPEDIARLSPLQPGEGPAPGANWSEKRLREYRAGRHVARLALADLQAPSVALPADDDGVPHFPSGVTGTISHTGRKRSFAVAAASRSRQGIGIDVEEKRTLSDSVERRVLRPAEREQALRYVPLTEAAVLIFSAKEAFYKCVFPQVRVVFGFQDVELMLTSAGCFRAKMLIDVPGCPAALDGRYQLDGERVVTAVQW